MNYTKSDMVYNDYKWTARADQDNPYYTKGTDYSQLNRSEGYEMLYFINHIVEKNWVKEAKIIQTCQLVEQMIREEVPSSIRTHKKIEDWINVRWREKYS